MTGITTGIRFGFLLIFFVFSFSHVGFSSDQYERFGLLEDHEPSILGESGFSILTEQKMQDLGCFDQEFNPVYYQISTQAEPGYLDRYQEIYDNFHALITITYNEYRNRTRFEHDEHMPESTLGSETGGSYFTSNILTLEGQVAKDISDLYPGNINTFKDAENEVIRPLIQFLYEKQKQLCFKDERLVVNGQVKLSHMVEQN